MFNWLRKRLLQKSRAIYRFWNGERFVCRDPMEIYRALKSHKTFDWGVHTQVVEWDWPVRDIVLDAIREVFGVEKFDPATGKGLLEEETLRLLWDYSYYCLKKNANTNGRQTQPVATAQDSSPDVSGEGSDTKPSLDFGSMLAAAKFDMPRA